ncbi:MAG: hypothetical protein WC455_12000 [Dehalococcoidia bacterium]|jgi:hypothetical protein
MPNNDSGVTHCSECGAVCIVVDGKLQPVGDTAMARMNNYLQEENGRLLNAFAEVSRIIDEPITGESLLEELRK